MAFTGAWPLEAGAPLPDEGNTLDNPRCAPFNSDSRCPVSIPRVDM
jgi:hypothetical protein